jgi:hypothetical protein
MVRAAVIGLALLATPAAAQDDPWAGFALEEPAPSTWTGTDDTGSAFFALREEARLFRDGSRTIWMHGDHAGDRTVPYRTSLTLYRFDCSDNSLLLAYTTYMANGRVRDDWSRGPGISADTPSWEPIRPGAILRDLADYACSLN